MKASKNIIKRTFIVLSCIALMLQMAVNAFAEEEKSAESVKTYASAVQDEDSYLSYYKKYNNENKPIESIKVYPNKTDSTIDGKKAITLSKNVFASEFNINEEGIYFVKINYRTLEEDSSKLQVSFKVDGEYPFDEAQRIELFRIYKDDIKEGKFETDKYDNDIRPSSEEIYRFTELDFSDYNSLYSEPYIFYLTKGKHNVEIKSENDIAVSEITVYNPAEAIKYSDYIKQYDKADVKASIRQEAELILEKNSDNIYPTYEKTNAATLPISASSTKLNTVGQGNWSTQGQTLSWKAKVEKAGLYAISFRVNQSYNENGSSYRKLLINGKVPFKEAESIEFPYTVRWYVKTLGDKEPYYVYLEPDDVITLECTADETCEISRNVMEILSLMSSVYREVFVITGPYPDAYTDYNLDVKIPDLMDKIKEIKNSLNSTIDLIVKVTGKKNSAASTLAEILESYQEMIDKPYDIHRYVTKMSDNITSMGSLVMSIGTQPLEIDCFYFTSMKSEIPSGKVSLIENIKYNIQRFLTSYSSEYGAFSGKSDKLKVWVSTGRDQLQIIQQMVENDFENQFDTKIELSLVDTGGTLLQATIAGKGPDVALMIPSTSSINLAFRDAVVDLNKYNVKSISDNFYESAWIPFYFQDGVYGIPETQVFNMLFYRTDVFEMLGIEPPETWNEFYEILEILQRNNYEVGIQEVGADAGVSAGIGTFSTFLMQRGGEYYTPDYKKTAFDTEEAYSSFVEWVELYSKYGLDRSFDFFNRFRTGVMAMSIQAYSAYNQLYAAAPEIRGLWKMAPVPATVLADGSKNNNETASVTGCMMLNSAEKKNLGKEAYEFMKWWTSAKVQGNYANELEAVLGIAARYTPANIEAFKSVGWKSEEYNALSKQFSNTDNFREVPGNYVLSRALTSAFRNALNSVELPERQLELYNKDINEEMERKAKEFGLY